MNRRGITPVIAVVLLLMMTVSVAGASYYWLSTVQTRIQGSVGREVTESTSRATDNMRVISMSNNSVVLYGDPEITPDFVWVYVNGQNRTLEWSKQGSIIEVLWDVSALNPDLPHEIDIISDSSNIEVRTDSIQSAKVFRGVDYVPGSINCGNAVCDSGENCAFCPIDCLGPGQVCCAGHAFTGECCTGADCSTDYYCSSYSCTACTDTTCNGVCQGSKCTGDPDCVGECCGNGVCGSGENCGNCPSDCACSAGAFCNVNACTACSTTCDGLCQHTACYTIDPDCDASGNPTLECCGNSLCGTYETIYNCPADCSQVDLIVFGGTSVTLDLYQDLLYIENGSPGTNLLKRWHNSSFIDVAYNNSNLPLVIHFPAVTQGSPWSYNVTYHLWTGSSWINGTLITNVEFYSGEASNLFQVVYPSVDLFSDNTAIFAWSNYTAIDTEASTIYYAVGAPGNVSPYQVLTSGTNHFFPRVRINSSDVAHAFYTDLLNLYHRVYDRGADSWSSPITQLSFTEYFLYPEIIFDASGNALLFFVTTPDTSSYTYYYSYYYGASFSTPVSIGSASDVCVTNNLGYDGTNWILNYNVDFDNGTHQGCIASSRTYNVTTGLTSQHNYTDFLVFKNSYPMYYNKHGSNAVLFIKKASLADIYYAYWNKSSLSFEAPELIYSNVASGGTLSCPFIYSFDGSEWHFEHEAYGFAVVKPWEYESYAVLNHLIPINDSLFLDLREELPETSYTNRLALNMVIHDDDVTVLPDMEGNIHTIRDWSYTINDLPELKSADGVAWSTDLSLKDLDDDADLRDELILTFDKPAGVVSPKLFLRMKETGIIRDSGVELIKMIGANNLRGFYDLVSAVPSINKLLTDWRRNVADLMISVWDGNEWVLIDNVGVGGAMWNDLLIPLGEIKTEDLIVKFEFSSHAYYFDEVKVDYSINEPVVINELVMIDGPDETRFDDGYYLKLEQDEGVSYSFLNVDCPVNKSCSYVVSVKGYYEIYPPEVDVEMNLGVIQKIIYLMTNPLETLRYCLKKYVGLDAGIDNVDAITTLWSLIKYFLS